VNSLHRASGLGANKAPAQWLRIQAAKDLVQELIDMQICTSPIASAKGGVGQGTFAHELLAIEYAGWISPSFRIKVNQTFIDHKTGVLQPNPSELSKMDVLRLAIESEEQKLQLEHQVEELKPKAEFHDKVAVAHDAISVGKAAKIIGTGRTRMFAFLKQIAWVNRKNEPYQNRIEAGLLDVKISEWEHPEKGLQEAVTALVTGKGLTKLKKLWDERNNQVA
jgi:phage antirepressor YoqD-like protein